MTGSAPKHPPPKVGQRFGRLKVLVPEVRDHNGQRAALCECECGNETTVLLTSLRSKNTTSCGCLGRERLAEKRSRSHGLSKHPLYGGWRGMLDRCENEVCEAWHDPATFIAWIDANLGPRPDGCTLSRIDSALGYRPGNVHWDDQSPVMRPEVRAKATAASRAVSYRGTEIGYRGAHDRARKVLPKECARGDDTCKGPLQVAFRHDAPAEFVRVYDGPNEKFLGLRYYVGPNVADGYMRLCASHHGRYDRNICGPKLNVRRVQLLRALARLGVLPESLAAVVGISREHLHAVLHRKVWRDVPDE